MMKYVRPLGKKAYRAEKFKNNVTYRISYISLRIHFNFHVYFSDGSETCSPEGRKAAS